MRSKGKSSPEAVAGSGRQVSSRDKTEGALERRTQKGRGPFGPRFDGLAHLPKASIWAAAAFFSTLDSAGAS